MYVACSEWAAAWKTLVWSSHHPHKTTNEGQETGMTEQYFYWCDHVEAVAGEKSVQLWIDLNGKEIAGWRGQFISLKLLQNWFRIFGW